MEDYTYDLATPGSEKILGAHMLEVCPSIAGTRPTLEIHPLGIGGREDPVRLRFTAAPGPAVVVGINDMGDRFRLTLNEVAVVEPDAPLPNLPVACAVWEPKPDFATSAEAWILAGGTAPHRAVDCRGNSRVPRPRDDAVHRARGHRRLDDHPGRAERAAVERGLPPPRRTLVVPGGPTTRWRWWTKIASVTGPKPQPPAGVTHSSDTTARALLMGQRPSTTQGLRTSGSPLPTARARHRCLSFMERREGHLERVRAGRRCGRAPTHGRSAPYLFTTQAVGVMAPSPPGRPLCRKARSLRRAPLIGLSGSPSIPSRGPRANPVPGPAQQARRRAEQTARLAPGNPAQ